MNVKIIGAGSIGNHLAHAARTLGWHVTLCDHDPAALERTRTSIYPSRYGTFDPEIHLCTTDEAPQGGFDWIFIGTPPDSHVPLALEAVKEKPAGLLVEKPFTTPDLEGCTALVDAIQAAGIQGFTGYDHALAPSVQAFEAQIPTVGTPQTLDVVFREHWQGIFNAHPWLDGPADSYLGFWTRGGGACAEHSHALHLWQHIARNLGAGAVVEVSAMLDYVQDGVVDYDRLALINLRTSTGFTGSVTQDVVTSPPLKAMRLQGEGATLYWQCHANPYRDTVSHNDQEPVVFAKTRPDDFITELKHLEQALQQGIPSPITMKRGLETALVIAAAHLSARVGRKVYVDHTKDYTQALSHA